MSAAERITAGDVWFDGIAEFEPDEVMRPVIVEVTTQHVIWVGLGEGTAKEIADGQPDLYESLSSENVLTSWLDVSEVEYGSDWWEIYGQLGFIGPKNAPAQGPAWKCPESTCLGYQPPDAAWPRRHTGRCPHATDATP